MESKPPRGPGLCPGPSRRPRGVIIAPAVAVTISPAGLWEHGPCAEGFTGLSPFILTQVLLPAPLYPERFSKFPGAHSKYKLEPGPEPGTLIPDPRSQSTDSVSKCWMRG